LSVATEFSPAKLNLFLAVTGRRPDGYHDLVSVVAPLRWGDELAAAPGAGMQDTLECADPAVPQGEANLILRAAAAFRAAGAKAPPLRFALTKRIPMGAGLGGGSSNAVAALRLCQAHATVLLPPEALAAVAAGIGADCSLFLARGPAVMRGRGERVSALPGAAASRLRGRRVLVFKPGFGIATAWAYGRLAASPNGTLPAPAAEARLQSWLESAGAPAEDLLFNSLEAPAFAKFPALPLLLAQLQRVFGLSPRMTGSGSACFLLLPPTGGPDTPAVIAAIRSAWGPSTFVVETALA
jgi:4-diphosphocytidyl-2-C-methyl-D-erythritol kinase